MRLYSRPFSVPNTLNSLSINVSAPPITETAHGLAPRAGATGPSKKTLIFLLASSVFISCQRGSDTPPAQAEGPAVKSNSSSMSFLFNPDAGMMVTPDIYELSLIRSAEAQEIIASRRGELGNSGSLVKIKNLPAVTNASVKATLYLKSFSPDTITHNCTSQETVNLSANQTASVALNCYDVSAAVGAEPVKIIYKVATLDASLNMISTASIIANMNWTQPKLFVGTHKRGIRVSLRSWGQQVKLYVGGKFTYISDNAINILDHIESRRPVTLFRDGGQLIDAAPTTVEMSLGTPTLYQTEEGYKAALPIEVKGTGEFSVSGMLFEQNWSREFTIAGYNVENLFDQEDVDRNAHYGDFRILPNDRGQHSNWGDSVKYDGELMSFTSAKIKGIVKVITAIEPTGPAYINLQEIESKSALKELFEALRPFGYIDFAFTEWSAGEETAVGLGVVSKFPILDTTLLKVEQPVIGEQPGRVLRPVFRVSIEPIPGRKLVVYNNHWKSKGGPESFRMQFARTVSNDIKQLIANDPFADYIVTGDFNCDYNESVILNERHNNTDGLTGMNDVLKAQGDELAVATGTLDARYNLHYELPMGQRKTAWYSKFGWSSFDNFVIGKQLYDQINYTYVDNSFSVANPKSKSLGFLFDRNDHPIRWKQARTSRTYSKHQLGGYSDHLPVHARFYYSEIQSEQSIRLINPGRPDRRDKASSNKK